MSPRSLETERKYDLPEQAAPDIEALRSAVGADAVRQEEHRLLADYLDTEDGRLARRLRTLRRREGGHDEGWHLKLPADGGRTEVTAPLSDTLPEELRAEVAGIVRGRELRPVARLLTRRRSTYLLVDDQVLVEVSDDTVAGTETGTGVTRLWREWEVELGPAAPDDPKRRQSLLDALEEALDAAGAKPASSASKLARALGRDTLAEPVPVLDDGSALSVVLSILRRSVDALLTADAALRTGDAEGAHRMRVSVRRLSAALAGFRGVVDRREADALRQRLKRIARRIAPLREADVRRAQAERALASVPLDTEVQQRVRDEAGRTALLAPVLEWLDSEEYFALLDELEHFVERPPLGPDATAKARAALKRGLKKAVRKAARRVDAAKDDLTRHEARKALRRVRYLAEALRTQEVLGKKATALADAAESAQDAVGDHRDSAAFRESLAGIPDLPPTAAAALDAGEEEREREALDRWKAARKRFRKAAADW